MPACHWHIDPTRLRAVVVDVLFVVLTGVFAWVYTSGAHQSRDISLQDESTYLHNGLMLGVSGIPKAQDAPLYAIWYHGLSLIQRDPVSLYYLNDRVMCILPAMLLFLLLRRFRVHRLVCFISAGGLLLVLYIIPYGTFISHFALIVLIASALIISKVRNRMLLVSASLLAALLVSYIRPEFFLSALALGVLFTVLAVRTLVRTRSLAFLKRSFLVVAVCALVFAAFGLPFRGGRKTLAFGQHYACNWVEWHHDPRDPWTHWESIVKADFGHVVSPIDAMTGNPSAFMHHVRSNIAQTPSVIVRMFEMFFRPGGTRQRILAGAFCIGLVVLLIARRGMPRGQLRDRIREVMRNDRVHIAIGAAFVFPSVVSILVFAPRIHYLLMCVTMLGVSCAILFAKTLSLARERYGLSLAMVCACTVFAFFFPDGGGGAPSVSQPTLSTILHLRACHYTEPVRMLEIEGGYWMYLTANYSRVPDYEKEKSFRAFLQDYAINMVLATDLLRNSTRYANDAEWISFLERPSDFGFHASAIPGANGVVLLVKNDLK
jgi:hypothetical protein